MNTFKALLWTCLLSLAGAAQGQVPAANPDPFSDLEKLSSARPEDLRVVATIAMRAPLDSIRKPARDSVQSIFIEYGSARGNLKNELLAGQEFDVALLLPDVDTDLLARGKILPQRYEIARIPVGISLRGDVAAMRIGTPRELKAALLKARSVKYAPTGAAHDCVDRILGTLGIATRIKDTSWTTDAVALGDGEYELGIFPISEIIANHSVRNLGVVPRELQVPVVIEAVIGSHAKDPQAAQAFVRFLQGPAIDQGLRDSGMVKGNPRPK